jgi:uncharacterized protein (TIGR02145 family)
MRKIYLLFALGVLCAGAAFGQSGTVIGGSEWANTNVAKPNTFAPRADMYTELYQWNRLTAWSIFGSVSGWHSANYDDSPAWTVNPCPIGWRLPTPAEFRALSNAGSTWAAANTKGNAVNGRFYGANHASATMSNLQGCIFLPAIGSRFNSGEVNGHTRCGMYWANVQSSPFNGAMLHFEDSKSPVSSNSKGRGVPVRCARGSYTVINGLKWADTNVDSYQTFAPRPDMYTKFYQWNRATAYSATNPLTPAWNSTADQSATWTINPCPAGWRLPTHEEYQTLHNAGSSWADANTRGNAVAGRFYGVNHASCTLPSNMNGCIFLPAVGNRQSSDGKLGYNSQGSEGNYWSNRQYDSDYGYCLRFSSTSSSNSATTKAGGMPIRCVKGNMANVPVVGVSLSPATATLTLLTAGYGQSLHAYIQPASATNENVTWSSDNTAVATVSSRGFVTAVAVGSATITVTTQDGGKTATCELTVSTAIVAVEGVELNETADTLTVGETLTLMATVLPANATNPAVTWASSDDDVATVADGLVTAKAAGTAIITVTTQDGEKTATRTLTVKTAIVAVESVELDKTADTLTVDETLTLMATVLPANATNQAVTWASSDDNVATVVNGLVTAVAKGTAIITVTTQDGNKTATCNLTVNFKAPTAAKFKHVRDKALSEITQTETFTAEAGVNFTSEKGVQFTIAANSMYLNGNPVTGEVTLKFVELYDRGNMLVVNKALIGTAANGAKGPMITGGQFYISLTKDGQQVKAYYNMRVPAANTGAVEPAMSLWTGEENENGDLVWNQVSQGQSQDSSNMGTVWVEGGYYNVFGRIFNWINCDLFYGLPGPKTQIWAGVPEGYDGNNSMVYIVFKDRPGTLAYMNTWDSDKEMFTENYNLAPVGYSFFLVFVSVQEDEQYVYAVKDVTVAADQPIIFEATELNVINKDDLITLINNLP